MENIQSKDYHSYINELNEYWSLLDRLHIDRYIKKQPIFTSLDEANVCRERNKRAHVLLYRIMDQIPDRMASKNRDPELYDTQYAFYAAIVTFRIILLRMNAAIDTGYYLFGDRTCAAYALFGKLMKTAAYKKWDKARTRVYQQTPEGRKARKEYDASRLEKNRHIYAEMTPEKKAERAAKNAMRYQARKLGGVK